MRTPPKQRPRRRDRFAADTGPHRESYQAARRENPGRPLRSQQWWSVDPFERLRILLRLERQAGVSFADAWPRATQRVAADQSSPAAWLEVFEWSRAAWQRAFEDKPRTTVDWLAEGLPVREGFTASPGKRVELVA